jgi:hypothetical protein
MQILDINGKKWMIGVEWEILPGDSTIKSESKEVAEKTNSKYGLVLDYDSTYAIGLTKKEFKEPSLALYLALANQNMRENGGGGDYPDWIALEEAGEDKYWMGVIKSGIPAPQFDAVLSITEVKDRITELLINDTYTVYTSANEIISIFDGIKHIEKRSVNDLTSDIKTKIKFQKLLGIPTPVIYGGVIFVAICIVAYGSLQFIDGRNAAEKVQNLAQKQEREKKAKQDKFNSDMKIYHEKKKNIEEEQYEKLVQDLSGNPSKILKAFYDNVGNSSVGTHGWSLTTIDCYYDVIPEDNTPPVAPIAPASAPVDITQPANKANEVIAEVVPKLACDYLYKRNNLSTTRMLLEDFPNAKLNGDNAIVTKQVEIDPTYVKKADRSILETLSLAKDWGFNVQSQLQLLTIASISHDIKSSAEMTYKIPGKPLNLAEEASGRRPNAEETIKLGVGKGELSISSKNFDWIKELADNVDFSGTGIKKVVFTMENNGGIAWVAHFNYYIKTKDGNIGASSSATSVVEDTKSIGNPVKK